MAKVSAGLGGRGVAVGIERKAHPSSHFEIDEMKIKKAHDGSFVIHHNMRLKKRHEGKEDYMGSYREPETHTAANIGEVVSHVKKHLGGGKAVAKGESAAEEAAEGDE